MKLVSFKAYIKASILCILGCLSWMVIEYIRLGKIIDSKEDNIIMLVIYVALYFFFLIDEKMKTKKSS
jgi:hypothetical protein